MTANRSDKFVTDLDQVTITRAPWSLLVQAYTRDELADKYARGAFDEDQARAYEEHFDVKPEQAT